MAYLSIIHPDIPGTPVQHLRQKFATPLIANTGFQTITDRRQAHRIIETRAAEMIAARRPAIANPDLPARWMTNAIETPADPSTFYSGGNEGYIDYLPLSEPASLKGD